METTLHQQLKRLYAAGGAAVEVPVGGYRADASVGRLLVEIQCSTLTAIRPKLQTLLGAGHHVLLVKPFATATHVRYRPSNRQRTYRHDRVALFQELVPLRHVFPSEQLIVDIVFVELLEERHRERGARHTRLVDRRLRTVNRVVRLREGPDLWQLLPVVPSGGFTTRWLAEACGISLWLAQCVAYCLRECGAARPAGRDGRFRRYEPVLSLG